MAKSKNRKGHKQRVQSRNERIASEINRQRKEVQNYIKRLEETAAKNAAASAVTPAMENSPESNVMTIKLEDSEQKTPETAH